MSQRIMGLEIGLSSIKVVRLDRTFSGIDFYDSTELQIIQNGSSGLTAEEGLKKALAELVSAKKLSGDFLGVSLPGNTYSVRRLTLPFDDPKKIEQVLAFEMEDLLPFQIDELVTDYYLVGQQGKSSDVLATAMLKKDIRKYLDILSPLGIEPSAISLGPFAFFNYYTFFADYFGSDFIAVNTGKDSTTILQVKGKKLTNIRTIPHGKNQLRVNSMEHEQTPQEALKLFANQIKLTIHAFTAGRLQDPAIVYLEGAKIEGLREELSGPAIDLKSDTDILRHPRQSTEKKKRFSPFKVQGSGLEVCCGLALSEAMGNGKAALNFRRGEFSYEKKSQDRTRLLSNIIVGVILVLSLAMVDSYQNLYRLEAKTAKLKEEIRSVFTKTFPATTRIVDETQQMTVSMKALQKKRKILGDQSKGVLFVLSKITDEMPADITIDTAEMVIEGATVSIQATTDSFEAVDKVKNSLQFKDVKVSDAKVAADGKRVKFRLTITMHEEL